MNYVELHIGDFEKDTAHLTACEDGIYNRMLRRYYNTETELPLEVKAVQRLVRARSKDELAAVPVLLAEFFTQTPTGWRHERCEREIAKYQEKRAKAQRSANARWDKSERNANASPEHGERNAHQSPVTRHQHKNEASGECPPSAAGSGDRTGAFEGQEPPRETPNPVAAFAIALIQAGFQCTALNPDLVAYVDAGGTVEHLQQCAALGDCRGKPATYVIRIARRELATTAAPVAPGQSRETFPAQPSRQAQGVAAILGVNAHDLVANFARGSLVREAAPAVPRELVPAEPGRLPSR